MTEKLAFPTQADTEIDLVNLAYVEAREPDSWVLAGPHGIPFLLELARIENGVDEVSLSVPSFRVHNWGYSPKLEIGCENRGIRMYLPKSFVYPEGEEDRAYALLNHMAYMLRIEQVRTARGVVSDMTDLLQALANLTNRKFTVICAIDEDGAVGIRSAKDDLIENTAILIALYFSPIGTSPASITTDHVDRRQPTELPPINPEKEMSAHQRLKDTAKLQSFLNDNARALGLTKVTLRNRLRAIGIE